MKLCRTCADLVTYSELYKYFGQSTIEVCNKFVLKHILSATLSDDLQLKTVSKRKCSLSIRITHSVAICSHCGKYR